MLPRSGSTYDLRLDEAGGYFHPETPETDQPEDDDDGSELLSN